MKSLLNFTLFLLTLFILSSCLNEDIENIDANYEIQNEVEIIKINWTFGTIKLTESNKFEFSANKINPNKFNFKLDNKELLIEYSGNDNVDLTINLNDKKVLSFIYINGFSNNIFIDKTTTNSLEIHSKVGQFEISNCKINQLKSYINAGELHECCVIKNSQIENCEILYDRIHLVNLTNNIFDSISLNLKCASTRISQNSFEKLNLVQDNGDVYIDLNGNYGYTFNILCENFSLDFETINYYNKFIYKNGEKLVSLKNTNGSFDIRRYFN